MYNEAILIGEALCANHELVILRLTGQQEVSLLFNRKSFGDYFNEQYPSLYSRLGH